MNFKRYVEASDTWVDSHYIKGTGTDTITTLPAIIYPLAQTATIGLKGNTIQNGTPTPDNPVMSQGTGERTGNLFDDFDIVGQVPSVNNGNLVNSSLGGTTSFIKMGSAEIVLSYNAIANIYLFLYDNDSQFIGYKQKNNGEPIYSTSISGYSNAVYCRVRVDNLAGLSNANLMLNSGSAHLPYEPYGYKIPISSANTTTNIYLGEVQSTRKIRKVVFDGLENWRQSSDGNFFIALSPNQGVAWTRVLSTHFTSSQIQTNGRLLWFVNASVDFGTVEECKTYLAQQYAAGTPVTIWYVLAEPTTGIVNEPLRKIGDYADTVSGITIPTIAGANTLSVDTTLQPSKVTATYKGWHPVTDVHERENGAWT